MPTTPTSRRALDKHTNLAEKRRRKKDGDEDEEANTVKGPSELAESFDTKTQRFDNHSLLQKYSLEKKAATLVVLSGTDAGKRLALADNAVLGRTIDADIVFHDGLISRRHAEVVYDEESGTFIIKDLDSTNGVLVNNLPVSQTILKDGDKIFLGATVLKFVLEDDLENESNALVDRLMFQDDLTGLVVKRRFYSDLRLQLQAAGASGEDLSMLMMDLDGLKQINDSHGHPVGAYIISEAGKEIGRICNPKGQACRYGGDEFIAYLTETSKEEALRLGESIRSTIAGRTFNKDGVEHRVSISIGVATFPRDSRALDGLTKAADDALYRAKEKGRNTVCD